MNTAIKTYNDSQLPTDQEICSLLCKMINQQFPDAESKIWHAHPVWFLDGNPVVGYSNSKIPYGCCFGVGNPLKKTNCTMKAVLKRPKCVLHQKMKSIPIISNAGCKNPLAFNGIIKIS